MSSLSKRTRVVCTIFTITAVAATMLLVLGKVSRSSGTIRSFARNDALLAYGDSLTAGTSGHDLFPYAAYLEAKLSDSVSVQHVGLPGWTTQNMLDSLEEPKTGLVWNIRESTTNFSLVILLAGTNDLGRSDALTITENILQLHKQCYQNGISRTLMIGIPPSAYQSRNQEAADKASTINQKLKEYAETESRATYVDFPFEFERNHLWYPDGLHLTKDGYQLFGESLAPTVKTLLAQRPMQQPSMV